MADYAKLDDNNQVIGLNVIEDSKELNNGVVDEATGVAYLTSIHGYSNWKRTDKNTINNTHLDGGTPYRGNYATIGGYYDSTNDIFLPQKPYSSWTLNTTTADWDPPIAYPTVLKRVADSTTPSDQYCYLWDENNQRWICTDDYSASGNVTDIWDPATSSWSAV